MKNEEILKKAIEKAVENGYKIYISYELVKMLDANLYYSIILSHDFAKAFWGNEKISPEDFFIPPEDFDIQDPSAHDNWYMGGGFEGYGDFLTFKGVAWQYHLQQMVLEEEPIKYLKKFL